MDFPGTRFANQSVDGSDEFHFYQFLLNFLSRLVEIFHTLGGGIRGGDWKRLLGWKDWGIDDPLLQLLVYPSLRYLLPDLSCFFAPDLPDGTQMTLLQSDWAGALHPIKALGSNCPSGPQQRLARKRVESRYYHKKGSWERRERIAKVELVQCMDSKMLIQIQDKGTSVEKRARRIFMKDIKEHFSTID
jgi:hypothetical protein